MIRPRSDFSELPSLMPHRTAARRKPLGPVTPPPISKNVDSMVERGSPPDTTGRDFCRYNSLHSKSRRFVPAVHDVETLDSLACGSLDNIVFRRHQNNTPSSRINAPSHFQPIRTHYVFQVRVSTRAQQSNEPFGAVGGLIGFLKSFDGQTRDRLRVNRAYNPSSVRAQ